MDTASPTAIAVDLRGDAIERLIPHRAPFRLIDRIEVVDFAQCAIAGSRAMDPRDPVFAGHFPDYPLYPGVLQVEMIGQLAVCYHVMAQRRSVELPPPGAELKVRALKIEHALFQHELRPGDQATILGRLLEADDFRFRGIGQVIKAGGEVCTVVVAEFFIVE